MSQSMIKYQFFLILLDVSDYRNVPLQVSEGMTASYLASVREQYEDLPYPPRNPADEYKTLQNPFIDALDLVNHYAFDGRLILHNNFMALVAGGGTGDAAIYLAEQLRDTGGRVSYVDISARSMGIAQARARVRGLTNIDWHHGSLLDLPKMGLGRFDYINCCGVLHHLTEPEAGLAALEAVLAPDGVIGLMVYGAIGRIGVYHVQHMLRLLTAPEQSASEKLEICRRLLAELPKSNFFSHSSAYFTGGIGQYGDAELYDLFLHSQDRAYTVPQLYDFLGSAGLKPSGFVAGGGIAKALYAPESYTQDALLASRYRMLPEAERYALAELLSGAIIMHLFYATREARPVPSPRDPEMVPFLSGLSGRPEGYLSLASAAAAHSGASFTLKHPTQQNSILVPRGRFTDALLSAMNGTRTQGEMMAHIAKGQSLTPEAEAELWRDWETLYDKLHFFDWVLLRHQSTLPFPTPASLQARFLARRS